MQSKRPPKLTPRAEYRTTDTNELAPYPDMTSDGLKDFEEWAAGVEANGVTGLVILAVVGVLILTVIAGLLL